MTFADLPYAVRADAVRAAEDAIDATSTLAPGGVAVLVPTFGTVPAILDRLLELGWTPPEDGAS